MGKPTKHGKKWRIRWTDHTGARQSDVFDRREDAELASLRHRLEVAEIRRCCGREHSGVTAAHLRRR